MHLQPGNVTGFGSEGVNIYDSRLFPGFLVFGVLYQFLIPEFLKSQVKHDTQVFFVILDCMHRQNAFIHASVDHMLCCGYKD